MPLPLDVLALPHLRSATADVDEGNATRAAAKGDGSGGARATPPVAKGPAKGPAGAGGACSVTAALASAAAAALVAVVVAVAMHGGDTGSIVPAWLLRAA